MVTPSIARRGATRVAARLTSADTARAPRDTEQPGLCGEQPQAPPVAPRPPRLGGDNPSMALADAQQQRLLELLREAGEEPTPFAELHAGGIASRPPSSPSSS